MNFWKKCSTCKKEICFQSTYFVCSVSSCNTKRTGLIFCGISCFDSHVPGARHKSAGAVEETSPRQAQISEERAPQRRIVSPTTMSPTPKNTSTSGGEVLVVASRLKDYIQNQAGFNTSANVLPVISEHLRQVSQVAIDNAKADGRKTVMDKDFRFLRNLKS